jgi:hypothetical protein
MLPAIRRATGHAFMRSSSTPSSTPAIVNNASDAERARRAAFIELYRQNPLPTAEQLANLGLFMNRQSLSRLLFMHELYQKALPVHGVVMEFGTRWGQNIVTFTNLRGIYEPYNYTRRIIAFDTFEGFPTVDAKDGSDKVIHAGAYAVTQGYEDYLDTLMHFHEAESPLPHMTKFELVKGDVCVTLEQYLAQHPETIVALAYFDVDLYEPTRKCLELLRPHLTKGSVLGFDELNFPAFPGETVALREVMGLDRHAIRRSPLSPTASYLVVD